MTCIRGILIDPIIRTVGYCDIDQPDGSAYDGLLDLVFKHHEQPGYLEGVRVGAGHSLYVDENGVLCNWDEQSFFVLRQGEHVTEPFAGVGILVRNTPDGDITHCELPLWLIQESVQWIDRTEVRVRAPFMTSVGPDGKEEKTLLAGVEYWTYNNQP